MRSQRAGQTLAGKIMQADADTHLLPSTPPPRIALEATRDREQHSIDRAARVRALRVALDSLTNSTPRETPWALELGCGHGHFLTAFAAHHVALRCLGIDFSRDRIGRAQRKQQRTALSNLHFIHAEAGEFFDALPQGLQFRHLFVLFPDPWPKRRHRKNRLVSARFLERAAEVASPGGQFFFRSDALDYVAEVRAAVAAHACWRLEPTGGFPFEAETVFQAKAARYESVVAQRTSQSNLAEPCNQQ